MDPNVGDYIYSNFLERHCFVTDVDGYEIHVKYYCNGRWIHTRVTNDWYVKVEQMQFDF